MEKYLLKNLLKFLQEQKQNQNYKNIDVILEVYGNEKTPKIRKWALIVSALRHLGLYEENLENKEGKIEIETVYYDSFEYEHKYGLNAPVEIFPVNLINGKIIFESILN